MSHLNDKLAHQFRDARIPFRREVKFSETRRWRFDFWIEDGNFAIDVQGGIWTLGAHVRGKGYLNDIEKHNSAAIEGIPVLWMTSEHINSGEALVWTIEMIQKRRTS